MVHYFEPPIDDSFRRRFAPKHSPDDPVNENANNNNDENDNDNTATPPPPPTDFPHAPLPRDTVGPVPNRTSTAPAPTASQQRNFARQHFNVLNTILHKSLLEHDFPRAARAFGLLLRVKVAGQGVDLRHKGLWGIGAEVLLRQQQPERSRGRWDAVEEEPWSPAGENAGDERVEDGGDTLPTDEGFALARDYYERLILQYPHRRIIPDAISAQHFYPPLFGIWIFQAQTRSQRAAAALQSRGGSPRLSQDRDDSNASDAPFDAATGQSGLRAIKARELEDARAIAERLADVTSLPPYDHDAELLKLRGMVAAWMADLVDTSAGVGAVAEEDADETFTAQKRKGAAEEARELRAGAKLLLQKAREFGWMGQELDGFFGGVTTEEESRDEGMSDDY